MTAHATARAVERLGIPLWEIDDLYDFLAEAVEGGRARLNRRKAILRDTPRRPYRAFYPPVGRVVCFVYDHRSKRIVTVY